MSVAAGPQSHLGRSGNSTKAGVLPLTLVFHAEPSSRFFAHPDNTARPLRQTLFQNLNVIEQLLNPRLSLWQIIGNQQSGA